MSVDVKIDEGIAIIVLNRPEAMNSIDPETNAALRETWKMVRDTEQIRVAILTGAGDRAFSTGSDLKKTMPPPHSFARQMYYEGDNDDFISELATIFKPFIAAVNGYCIAGGLELALACDLRIAAENAQFGLAEARIGSIPGAGGTQRLPRMIGQAVAMKMLLTGERIDALEALRVGLVSDVVPSPELMPLAMRLARQIAENGPLSVRAIKMLVQQGMDMPLNRAMLMERMSFGLLRNTEDRVEGRIAFQEKRKPVFRGR